MKEFAIIIAVLALQGVAAYYKDHSTRLSAVCYNQNGVLVPMRGSCSGFFICVNGNAIASSCGDYFHFNARTGYCDHPERAACFAEAPTQIEDPNTYLPIMPMLPTLLTTASPTITPPPALILPQPQYPDEVVADIAAGAICQKQRNGVQLPNPAAADCTQYYVCILQRPYRRTCPTHKQFSVAHSMCVWSALAQCFEEVQDEEVRNQEMTISTIEAPLPRPHHESSPTSCTGVAPGSLLPHPTDCGKFLSCSTRKRAFEMRCPEGLHFSAFQLHCDWPQNAKCASSFQ